MTADDGRAPATGEEPAAREVSPFVATDPVGAGAGAAAAAPGRVATEARTERVAPRQDFAREALRERLFGHTRGSQEIGRYTVERVLGAGGMGQVVAARDPLLDRAVAIKLIREDRASASFRARLLREAQAMARLTHPNVVQVFEAGEDGDEIYVVMELVDGVDLRAWLHRRPRPAGWREVLGVLVQAGRGLAAAHAAGLVHRDFKPENVFVGDDGRVRVGDFGLARPDAAAAAEESSRSGGEEEMSEETSTLASLTATGAVMGTPAYMAPEQHLGRATDARCDQFAFCVTLWEALSGSRPFAGETLHALVDAVVEGRRRAPPRGHRAPARLWEALARGLSTAPDERFPSMDALLEVLEGELDGGARRVVDSDPARARRNELLLVAKVRSFWVDGILRRSLDGAAPLELGLVDRRDAVARGRAHHLEEAEEGGDEEEHDGGARTGVATTAELAERFDRRGRALLLLGAPGSGKTIALLELAAGLLERAADEPDAPVPVVLSLASWTASAGSLEGWITEEIAALYRIPRRLTRRWLDEDALALLLDGLDEVAAGARDACVAAINAYRDEHGVAAIAVTCREVEGAGLRAPLQLDDAVALRPLTESAVVDALPPALRGSLAADPALRELARQPLFLGILRQLDAADVAAIAAAGELEARRLAIFDRYVRGALTRVRRFSGVEAAGGAAPALAGGDEGRALRWLAWLGRAMTRGRGVFLLEELQPRDLASAGARWSYVALTRGVVAASLVAWLIYFGRGGAWRELTALAIAAAVVVTIAGGRRLAGDARAASAGVWRASAAIVVAVPALFAGVALLMVPEARAEPRAWFAPARLAVAGVVAIACASGHVVRRRELARGRDVVAPETRRFDRRRFGVLVALLALLPALAVGGVLSWRAAEAAVVWDVDSGARRALDADLAHATRALAWTADGRHVVINRYERAKIVDVDRDVVVREIEGWLLASSADGRRVVGDSSEGLKIWTTDAWDAPLAIDLGERGAWRFPLEFSADGRSLLVGVGADGDREARGHLLLNAEDGRVLRVFPSGCAAPGGDPASCTESMRWSGDRRHLVRTRGDGDVEAYVVDPLRRLTSVDPAELEESTAVGLIREAALAGGGATIERVTPDAAGARVALVIDAVDGPRTEVWDLAARARLLRAPGRGALSPDGARLFTLRSVSAPLPVAVASFVAGLLLALALAFRPGVDPGQARVNEGIRRSLWQALAAFVGGLLVVVALVLGYGASQGLIRGGALATPLFFAVVVGIAVGAAVALAVGGFAALGHAILRLLLAREGAAPLAYGRFLERATERAILRRVGGGYVFYHRLLAEYFAAHAERRLAGGRRADAERPRSQATRWMS